MRLRGHSGGIIAQKVIISISNVRVGAGLARNEQVIVTVTNGPLVGPPALDSFSCTLDTSDSYDVKAIDSSGRLTMGSAGVAH